MNFIPIPIPCVRAEASEPRLGLCLGNTTGLSGGSDNEEAVVHIRCRKRVRAAPRTVGASQRCREPRRGHRWLWVADSLGRFGAPLFGYDALAQEEGI